MGQPEAVKLAVQAAQRRMRGTGNLVADGKWGRYTQSFYDAATPDVRAAVDELLRGAGTTASDVFAARSVQKASATMAISGARTVRDVVIAVADQMGIDRNLLLGMAKIESNFNAAAVNGSSRGLLQMQPAAWTDAKQVLPDLPDYKGNVFDPVHNARAGAAYLKINMRRLTRAGFKDTMSPAVLYLAHQQGSGGFIELWRAFKGLSATTNYVTDKAMRGNPPQDGLGVTTDKATFYRRWIAAAARKIG
jgi:soluble lytic murein transglycosylase-like protein